MGCADPPFLRGSVHLISDLGYNKEGSGRGEFVAYRGTETFAASTVANVGFSTEKMARAGADASAETETTASIPRASGLRMCTMSDSKIPGAPDGRILVNSL